MENPIPMYFNLSNDFYTRNLPNLSGIDSNAKILRLAGLYLHDITNISHLCNLIKLNISFTYIKSIPKIESLEELHMIEIDLDDPNELANLKNLKFLKITHDNICLTKPLTKLEILHCSVIHRPDLLKNRFPNLKELRFEHIHPKNKISIDVESLKYYENIKYTHCKTSVTIFQMQNKNTLIDDFNDKPNEIFHKFQIDKYVKYFAEGKLEFMKINRDVHKFTKHNLSTRRKSWIMNIYENNEPYNNAIITLELAKDFNGKYIRYTISDKKFAKISDHYRKCTIYYGPEDDFYNYKNCYRNIIKNIIYDNFTISDSTQELLDNFIPKRTNIWSVDKLISDIKTHGLTKELVKKIKFFERLNDKSHGISEFCTKLTKQQHIISPSALYVDFYDCDKNELYKIPDLSQIKDKIWFSGKEITLNEHQKKATIDFLKKENKEFVNYRKNIIFAKFENKKIIHYKIGDDNEITQINVSDEENSNEEQFEGSNNNIVDNQYSLTPSRLINEVSDRLIHNDNKICSINNNRNILINIVPITDTIYTNNYVPDFNVFKNIFMNKNLSYVLNDANFWDISDMIPGEKINTFHTFKNQLFKFIRNLFEKTFSCVSDDSMTTVIKKIDIYNIYLCFYGRVCYFSDEMINQSNSYIMLGTSHDSKKCQSINVLVSKEYSDFILDLDTIFFIFKNKIYTSHCNNGCLLDHSNNIVIFNNGAIGWNNSLYPFNIIIEPHPNLNLDKDIIIESPLCCAIDHNKLYKCCI